ncbi:MAG: dipeptide/oligopeptide/nickel ABC transporter ATP-binding protein [Alsobacter sp.]
MTPPTIQLVEAYRRFVSGPVWRRRSTVALHPTDLAVRPSEIVAIVGESGSGKTTLANLCLGLLRPTGGAVHFEGAPLRPGSRALAGQLAAVLQNPASSLNPRMRIMAAIEEPMRISRQSEPGRAMALLERVGVADSLAARFPQELSGGQQQRVAIARALATRPRLIVFDEAVSALDVSVQAQILNLIRELRDDVGFACLFITHDIAVARYVADRMIVMRRGRIEDVVPSERLYSVAEHPYTRALQLASGLVPAAAATEPKPSSHQPPLSQP